MFVAVQNPRVIMSSHKNNDPDSVGEKTVSQFLYHIDSSLLTTSYWNIAANATSAKSGRAVLTSAFTVALQLNPVGERAHFLAHRVRQSLETSVPAIIAPFQVLLSGA